MRKIYVNENHEICALDSTDREDLTEIIIEDESVLGGWCDTALKCYKYEVSDGGYAFYPFVDTQVILGIQTMYDNSIRELETENEEIRERNETLEAVALDLFEEVETLKSENENLSEALLDIFEKVEVM